MWTNTYRAAYDKPKNSLAPIDKKKLNSTNLYIQRNIHPLRFILLLRFLFLIHTIPQPPNSHRDKPQARKTITSSRPFSNSLNISHSLFSFIVSYANIHTHTHT